MCLSLSVLFSLLFKAYKTFANRVSHLKRKLDSLKATLPDLDESPLPSPSMDAPSPNGSESPFRGLADPESDLDGLAMDDEAEITLGEAPSPLSSPGGSPKQGFTVGESDNRDVEDMELSDEEEAESVGIIGEEEWQVMQSRDWAQGVKGQDVLRLSASL